MRKWFQAQYMATAPVVVAAVMMAGCTEDEEPVTLSEASVSQSAAVSGGENLVLEAVFRDLCVGETTVPPSAVADAHIEAPIANASFLTMPSLVSQVTSQASLAMLPDAETITFSATGSTTVDLATLSSDVSGVVSVSWSGVYIPSTRTGLFQYPQEGSVDIAVTIVADDIDNLVTYTNANEQTATWALNSTWETRFEAEWTITGQETWEMTAQLADGASDPERSFTLSPDDFEGTVDNNDYLVSLGFVQRGPGRETTVNSAFFNANRDVRYTPVDAETPVVNVNWRLLNGAVWLTIDGVTDGPLTPAIVQAKYGIDALHFAP